MTARKHAISTSFDEQPIGSDLAKVDAHVIQPEEYDELPEWTDEMFERADFLIGGKLVRRGRPRAEAPKKAISIRLSQDVLDAFKAEGPGWQTRIDAALRDWLAGRGRG
ncbi:BrnA antitoxin family protein [Prosthecomicrobium pneumaticum]|uniref:Uncharacterized protein (DUF4415 family) n=1 Tax=Prosthecomicrobium pneumaticum TaxID=81895 RepID=A0A7W9FQX7_9HYPH|nr:BrnA antitoxin family protein [Prosthecomicrobium pneumaticum]MBB5755254.1 uncharacterized protein (DUF4415 family) [Prosthecomicrobium pneumaticum]